MVEIIEIDQRRKIYKVLILGKIRHSPNRTKASAYAHIHPQILRPKLSSLSTFLNCTIQADNSRSPLLLYSFGSLYVVFFLIIFGLFRAFFRTIGAFLDIQIKIYEAQIFLYMFIKFSKGYTSFKESSTQMFV